MINFEVAKFGFRHFSMSHVKVTLLKIMFLLILLLIVIRKTQLSSEYGNRMISPLNIKSQFGYEII